MTQVTPQLTQISKGSGQSGPQGSSASTTGTGVQFWEMIFASLASPEMQKGEETTSALTKQANETAPMLEKELGQDELMALLGEAVETDSEGEKPLSVLQLALLLQNENGELPADFEALRVERIENRIDQLAKLVDHLTNGLPENLEGKPMVESLLSRLEKRIDALVARLEEIEEEGPMGDGKVFPLLIAMGLTPSEITEMTNRIKEVEDKLGRELTVEDLIAGVANIIPLPDKSQTLLPVSAKNGEYASSLPSNTEPTDDLAAQLNSLVVGGSGDGEEIIAGYRGNNKLKSIELAQKLATGTEANISGQKIGQIISAGLSSFLQAGGISGNVAVPQGWQQAFFDGLELTGFDINAGLPLSSAAQAAHMATSVPQAGQSHPASQLVAATIQKAANEGTARNITIQLDPPDLGRVDVRLEFGHDKSVKAHLLVEKPETFMMLQRDAGMLERALQAAGLETDGGSLSFELAEDGSAFEQNNNSSGGNGDGASGDGQSADNEELIETTVSWSIDPETGHTRYDLFA